MKKIRTGDEVIVIAGKSKGEIGRVKRFLTRDTQLKVIVEGVNLVSKCERPNPEAGKQGGVIKKEAPLHISNIAIYDPETGKAGKVGIRILEDGRKVRYYKSSKKNIDSL